MTFFDWAFAWEILPLLLKASVVTLQITFTSYIIALVLGLVFAVIRRSKNKYISLLMREIIEFIRSTPVLVQIYFIYFVFPQFGISIPAFPCGLFALGLHYACYTSEAYRSGLDSVPTGQWEGATALNLSSYRIYRDIILPQAIPPIVPMLGNYLIGLFKETPLLSVIAIIELMGKAKIIGSDYYRYLEPVTLVGLIFLVMSLFAASLVQFIERRLNSRAMHGKKG